MRIREVKCKTALSPSSLPGLDYSLNPYRGCQHNCAYCYVPNVLRIPRSEWGGFVDVRKNIPIVLSKELKKKKRGVIGISTVTDPYQPVEKKYKLTRYCLEQLLIHDFPICIQTKSDLLLRDIDLISKFSNAEVMISIGTFNNSERKKLEPHSSSIDKRLNVLKQFSKRNVKTSVFFGPVYPTIQLRDIPNVIDRFKEYGVMEIMIDRFNFKPGIWENIEKTLFSDKKLKNVFKKNLLEDDSYTQRLFDEVIRVCNKKNVRVSLAF